MSLKQSIYDAAAAIRDARGTWYEKIAEDPEFQSRGGIIYPYDTTGANLDSIFAIFESSGFLTELEDGKIRTICDIGCANGELAFSFAEAGFDVTAIDYSYLHDQAPYVVSRVAEMGGWKVAIADMTVDRHFSYDDIEAARLESSSASLPAEKKFDLIICLGVLYHLKNPFAFLESLARISKNVLLGTHIFTHSPGLEFKTDGHPLAYLVDTRELNNDPTNFWIFTNKAFMRLADRCGFDVIDSLLIPNNPLEIGVPTRTDLGVRNFLMLRSR